MEEKKSALKGFKKLFKKEVPYNGGNSFQLQKILEQRDKQILSYVCDNKINREMYSEWELLNFQADYNASIVRFTFQDELIDNMVYLIFRLNFLYGNVGILFKDGKPIPIVENKTTIDEFGYIKKVEGFNGYELLQSNGLLSEVESKLKKRYNLTKKEIEENYIRMYAPSYNFGAYVRWMKFIKMWNELLKIINTYSYLLIKKVMYNVNDEAAAVDEIKRFFDTNSPFLINKDTNSPDSNKFEIAGGEAGGTNDIFTYYDRWLEIYYGMLGRRINVDRKKERNITNEVEMSENNFDILENEIKINRINFLNTLSKHLGKPVIIYDKIEEKETDEGSEEVGEESTKPADENRENKETGGNDR